MSLQVECLMGDQKNTEAHAKHKYLLKTAEFAYYAAALKVISC